MPPHDISSIMRTKLGGDPDLFGKETGARLPLLFAKVMEGRPAVSQSLLFRLPQEILGDIADLIADDKPSLASLALVNSDCRQLARSRQFAVVTFDYSPASRQLAQLLSTEAAVSRGPQSRGRRIGPCIRRVKVASDRRWLVRSHKELYDSIWGADRGELTDAKREHIRSLETKVASEYVAHYQMPILVGIGAMPNLEAISWLDPLCQSPSFFTILAGSSVQHIQYHGAVSQELLGILDQFPAHSFQHVRSLYIHFDLCRDSQHEIEEATITDCDTDAAKASDNGDLLAKRKPRSDCDVIAALIKQCEQSLETLVVRRGFRTEKRERELSLSGQDINLRSLRTLDLSCCELDLAAWRVMLCPSLRHLSIPPELDESCLSSCETLRNLETLVIRCLRETPERPLTESPWMEFLNRHPHIKKFCLERGAAAFIDDHLLPCLSNGNWTNLSSLSLTWEWPRADLLSPHLVQVSKSALAAIGSLDSLEQLSLAAGEICSWRRQWLIDHDAVRESLKGLTRLKRLAISRDTYLVPFDLEEPEYYYENHVADPEDRELAKKRNWVNELEPIEYEEDTDDETLREGRKIWEYAHRYRTFKQAEKYAEVIPTLEWIYCGEWPMKFVDEPLSEDGLEDRQTRRKIAWPLAKCRDFCSSFLSRTFGMGREEE